MVDIALPHPLRDFVFSCAVFCQPDCCGLDAFDVDAHTMLHWMRNRPDSVEQLGRELDRLISEVEEEENTIRIVDIRHEFLGGRMCADYFRTWRHEYSRALAIGPSGIEPGRRLDEALERGEDAYLREVYRMAAEGAAAEGAIAGRSGETYSRAIAILVSLARLDPNSPGTRREVEYARRVLNQQGVSWAP